ncbi:glycosyltransferase [Arsenicicoccus dermatophilus]|uniref:glycosyltransferase n=1 Tax=Arsenicicoccus dermatophilus TaxID=1076331 RepID=UPI003916E7B8
MTQTPPDAVGPGPSVAVIIPAKDEAARIAATVRATLGLPGVDLVVVVDDGSRDATQDIASQAGALVARHPLNRGKASALQTGLDVVARRDAREGRVGADRRLVLFVDADLEESAAEVGVLVAPVAQGEADMTIAVLPPQRSPGGGRGLVVGLARDGIQELTGWTPTQPLSGMRCLSPAALEAGTPLAPGWGVETALTVDVLSAGLRVLEVPCALHHRVTGSDWRGQLHRAEQYRDVLRALAVRRLRRRVGR